MPLLQVCVSFLILCIFVTEISATGLYGNNDDNDDDDDDQFKRFFFHSKTTTTQAPSVIDNLIHPSSTRSPPIWTQKSTYSPFNPSSGPCASNPCEHGGICTANGQMTYTCKCVGPWRGMYCGVANACYNSPCQNGGTCLNVHDDFWCQCGNDYYGKNCQTRFNNPGNSDNNCRPNICNTGRCISLRTTYYCQCPEDRYGENCEKRFYMRSMSKRKSYYQLLQQVKRAMDKQDGSDNYANDGRA